MQLSYTFYYKDFDDALFKYNQIHQEMNNFKDAYPDSMSEVSFINPESNPITEEESEFKVKLDICIPEQEIKS